MDTVDRDDYIGETKMLLWYHLLGSMISQNFKSV